MNDSATSVENKPKEVLNLNEEQKELEKTILRRDNEEYKIIKKLPKRFPSSVNDIYITNKTDFKAQYERCKHLLYSKLNKDKNEPNEIVLHAMGPAINRAINLALRLQKEKNCKTNCYTSTIILEDDLYPLVDSLEISSQHRHISAP
ncbi:unnamed protein product [Brachionus calyciflorus]|uniref:Uncharacterized protein n=1 Tax=Brachionus calyciflorus TaxID=104777 RepID=A0A813NK36_9BILA|nr:unnamed protein product [Brachionus calyciflorus]